MSRRYTGVDYLKHCTVSNIATNWDFARRLFNASDCRSAEENNSGSTATRDINTLLSSIDELSPCMEYVIPPMVKRRSVRRDKGRVQNKR